MSNVLAWLPLAHFLLAAWIAYLVLRRRQDPATMLAWILAAIALPVAGPLLYVLIGSNRLARKASRRRRKLTKRFQHWAREHAASDHAAARVSDAHSPIEQIGRRLCGLPATGGNEAEFFDDGGRAIEALIERIDAARRHINLQYYIWKPDEFGREMLDRLTARARSGVAVNLLLDAVGSFSLKRRTYQPLLDAGGRVAFYLPLAPLRKRWSLHLRNHRKIAVLDGDYALVGSFNIGNEYRGHSDELGPWHDSAVGLRGPAVLFAQQVFAEDWFSATGAHLGREAYFPSPSPAGDCTVQALPSGPDQEVSEIGQMVVAAVLAAREVVRIATPYFVPDAGLRMALAHAAYRGVKVQIVVPTRSDVSVVLWAGRSFYRELISAGIEIFEYDGGVLHSKMVAIDDELALLGSANMDVRSFELNFELTMVVYDGVIARQVARTVAGYCERSRRITPRDVWGRGLLRDLGEGAARLLAPLL